ncbi:hypothetical protein ACFL1W_01385, partial [Candidatus Margulisiibacteriota bacterium]
MGSVARGLIFRVAYPACSKTAARVKLAEKRLKATNSFNAPVSSEAPPMLKSEAEEQLNKIHFPTLRLIGKKGIGAFREIDEELSTRGLSMVSSLGSFMVPRGVMYGIGLFFGLLPQVSAMMAGKPDCAW